MHEMFGYLAVTFIGIAVIWWLTGKV